ncbi:putative transposase [Pseudomonas sp. NFACC06-1]|nr:putative transposase [Pseudomonas sp. NFACC06-1]
MKPNTPLNENARQIEALRRRMPDVERLRLHSRVSELLTQSRSAAGSRSILSLMREEGG